MSVSDSCSLSKHATASGTEELSCSIKMKCPKIKLSCSLHRGPRRGQRRSTPAPFQMTEARLARLAARPL